MQALLDWLNAETRAKGARLRHARKEGRAQVKEARKLLRRGRSLLGDGVRAQFDDLVTTTELTLRQTDPGAIDKATRKLGDATDKHLDAYRKPAWRESLESIAVAVLIALMLRSFVVEAFKIPSGSMIPTLAIGDQIFVNKLRYGIRIPFTSIRLVDFAMPQRGEVLVFICPVEPREDYIKRVIGLPGDEVAVRDGVVQINGEPLTQELIGEQSYWDRDNRLKRWFPFEAVAYRETIGEKSHVIIRDADPAQRAPDYGPFVVPEGHVFMMGDNRDHSFDSRAWGPVPLSNILGRSLFVWFSWGRDNMAWERLGTWIE